MFRKFFMLIGLLSLSTSGLFAQTNTGTVGTITGQAQTVQYALRQAKSLETVILEGVFSTQVDDDEYVFEDGTGRMIAELDKYTSVNGYPMMKNTMGLSGVRVRLRGVIKKKWSGRHEIKVSMLQVLDQVGVAAPVGGGGVVAGGGAVGNTPPPMATGPMPAAPNAAINGTVTTVQNVLRSSSNYQTVVLQGVFTGRIDDDEFIFDDGTGRIKAELSSHTVFAPYITSYMALEGAKVRIRGIVKKEWGDPDELKILQLQVLS